MSNINPDLNTLFLTGEKPMSNILILGLFNSPIQGQWTKDMCSINISWQLKAQALSESVLSILIGPHLKSSHVDKVINVLRSQIGSIS